MYGLSIKDVRSQGGKDLFSADIYRTRGKEGFQMRTFALFAAKKFEFF